MLTEVASFIDPQKLCESLYLPGDPSPFLAAFKYSVPACQPANQPTIPSPGPPKSRCVFAFWVLHTSEPSISPVPFSSLRLPALFPPPNPHYTHTLTRSPLEPLVAGFPVIPCLRCELSATSDQRPVSGVGLCPAARPKALINPLSSRSAFPFLNSYPSFLPSSHHTTQLRIQLLSAKHRQSRFALPFIVHRRYWRRVKSTVDSRVFHLRFSLSNILICIIRKCATLPYDLTALPNQSGTDVPGRRPLAVAPPLHFLSPPRASSLAYFVAFSHHQLDTIISIRSY